MKDKTGNRIVQAILLLIITIGFFLIAMVLKGTSGSMSGGPSGGGMPGGPGTPQDFSSPGSGEQEQTTIAVEVETVKKQTVSKFIMVNGDVVSDISVDIYSDVTGKIVRNHIHPGSYVKKGDIIAVVDPSLPGEVYSTSPIIATISGTITSVNADVGDTVNMSSSFAVIGDLENLSVLTYIPERFISYLKPGLNASVTFEAFPGMIFNAQVVQLNPVMDTKSRSLEIKLEILNPDSRIRVGMFASINLITQERKDVVAIQSSAISTYYNDSVVYVLTEKDRVERRVITLGLSSGELIEIKKGLSEGEKVVTQGITSVTDGTAVRVVNTSSVSKEN